MVGGSGSDFAQPWASNHKLVVFILFVFGACTVGAATPTPLFAHQTHTRQLQITCQCAACHNQFMQDAPAQGQCTVRQRSPSFLYRIKRATQSSQCACDAHCEVSFTVHACGKNVGSPRYL
jgi:hypothetical protein